MAIRADRVGVRQDQVDVHGRVTSPSFFNELLEDLPEWTDMPVWVNGTEELLPSNNSVPVTSPILADIAYPDIRRDNQYFTYRESPTPVDGLAKIKSIKGNTLVWNQLVQNGNFNNTTYWNASNVTFSVANNIATVTRELENTSQQGIRQQINNLIVNGNKYLISFEAKSSVQDALLQIAISDSVVVTQRLNYALSTSMATYQQVFTADSFDVSAIKTLYVETYMNQTFQIKNIMLIDLSAMFGQGNEPATVEEFTSLFSLPYYDFNQGSLLSFNGNGIKTVGKNLLDKTSFIENSTAKPEQTSTGVKVISKNGGSYGNVSTVVISNLTPFIGKTFILSADVQTSNRSGLALQVRDENNVEKAWRITYTTGPASVTLAITDDFIGCHLRVAIYAIGGSGVVGDYSIYDNLQLEIGSSQATSYEPYTESTLSLPISTYFPTGMKSAVSVYDELTPMKAITRIGSIDMSTLEWELNNPSANIFAAHIDIKAPSDYEARKTGFINPKYPPSSGYAVSPSMDDKSMLRLGGQIFIRDTDFSDVTALKTSLNGVYLYYELATPVELPTMSFE